MCIGWLDGEHPFERGYSPPEVITRIEEMCKAPIRRTRGWQNCPFCEEHPVTHQLPDGRRLALGDAEIDVQTPDVIYTSPTLVLHYITAHQYKPPVEYLNAINPEFRK